MTANSGSPRILVVGYCYPPTASPEAFVTAKLLRNLPDCRVDVLTLEDGMISTVLDEGMRSYAEGINGSIHRVAVPKFLQKMTGFPRLPFRPDRWLLTNPVVYRTAQSLLVERCYDCLVTRSQYHSAHLVGLSLKKKYPALPWIACFSDPWSNADHQKNVPLISCWSSRQERKVMNAADRLVFPTKGLQEHYAQGSGALAGKSAVLPHSFDKRLYNQEVSIKPGKHDDLVIRLFGSFYGARKPDSLFSAFDQLDLKTGVKLTLELYGPWHSSYENLEGKYPAAAMKRIRYMGYMPHIEALVKMQEADLLVLVDAPGQGESFYLPSKIVDYMGSKRPVLALCRDGVVSNIVRRIGGVFVDPVDVDTIGAALNDWIENRHLASEEAREFAASYEAANISAKFRSLIGDLI